MPSTRTILKRVSIGALAAFALVYLGDTLSVWHRMSNRTPDDPLTTMTTQPIIEIPQKDGRDQIVLGDSQTQSCVRALFPHDGYSPCWYVARRNQSTTMMTLLPIEALRSAQIGAALRCARAAAPGTLWATARVLLFPASGSAPRRAP
jgi:hypothetical protein